MCEAPGVSGGWLVLVPPSPLALLPSCSVWGGALGSGLLWPLVGSGGGAPCGRESADSDLRFPETPSLHNICAAVGRAPLGPCLCSCPRGRRLHSLSVPSAVAD